MNRIVSAGLSVITAVAFLGCEKGKAAEVAAEVSLATAADTISYLIGNDIARSLADIKDEVVVDVVVAGIKAKLAGVEGRIPADQERAIMQAFGMKMQQKQKEKAEEGGKANIAEEKAFLAENGKKEGVVTTPSGLQYQVITKGEGPVPTDTSRVKVHYEGTLLDGKVFDSSIKRGEPAVFGVNQVIRGWTEALKLMPVGSKYKLFIPSELAYGPRGMSGDIGPNKMLVFEVELISIEK